MSGLFLFPRFQTCRGVWGDVQRLPAPARSPQLSHVTPGLKEACLLGRHTPVNHRNTLDGLTVCQHPLTYEANM